MTQEELKKENDQLKREVTRLQREWSDTWKEVENMKGLRDITLLFTRKCITSLREPTPENIKRTLEDWIVFQSENKWM